MNDAEWFAEHTAYLATPEWAFRRGQVLNRDGYRCQARMPGCAGDAIQVHHTSYKHWRQEPLFELVSVCRPCHEQITAMDRANRPPLGRIPQRETESPRELLRSLLDRGVSSMRDLSLETGMPDGILRLVFARDPLVIELSPGDDGTPRYGLRAIGMDLLA